MSDADSEEEFWKEFLALLIQLGCLIEKKKLNRKHTIADLRQAGKQVLCDKNGS